MAKITKIKATDVKSGPQKEASKDTKKAQKAVKVAKKAEKSTKQTTPKTAKKKPFILIRPIVYLFRYIRDSWREIRQVRWPSRKATWKLFFAILIYTLLFVAVIMLLDALFTWLFETVI